MLAGESPHAMTTSGVEVRAVEVFADLLFALDSDDSSSGFYSRLSEAICALGDMDRAAIFLYDAPLRRVRAVGSHGIELTRLEDVHATAEETPIAMRALSEDRVVEVTGAALDDELPPEHLGFFSHAARLVCTPMAAAGRWPGVILSDRGDDRALTEPERHLLWTLGKVAALAASARSATRAQDRARELQERIDLAREIHDRVIQRLFGVSMALSAGGDLGREGRERAAQEIQDALADLRAAVQRPLGRASRETHTTLAEEVRRLVDEHPELHVELDAELGAEVPGHLEALAQSVFAEALRNAHRHAQPARVGVRMGGIDGAFLLEVTNDGVHAAQRTNGVGMGLRLAAFEALQHGGVIEFGQVDEGCWRVRLLVPQRGATQ